MQAFKSKSPAQPKFIGGSRKNVNRLPVKKLLARLRIGERFRKKPSANEKRKKTEFAKREKNGKKRNGSNENRSSAFRDRQRHSRKGSNGWPPACRQAALPFWIPKSLRCTK